LASHLSSWLRDSVTRSTMAPHVGTINPGEYRRTHLLSLLDVLHDKVISSGVLTEEQLRSHRKALLVLLEDPDTLLIDKLLVQAWGQI
jgi:hypothetical protein